DVRERYAVPFIAQAGGVREARPGDGAWRALAAAIEAGSTIAALTADGDAAGPDAVLVCRPSPRLADPRGPPPLAEATEPALDRDQSNASVVLGERLLLKAYRRIQPGLNPDLELTAYLSEEAGFAGVPRVAGWAEVVTREDGASTVPMLQAFVAGGEDPYQTTAAPPPAVDRRPRTGGPGGRARPRGGLRAARGRPPRRARRAAGGRPGARAAAGDPRRAPRVAHRRPPTAGGGAGGAPGGGRRRRGRAPCRG